MAHKWRVGRKTMENMRSDARWLKAIIWHINQDVALVSNDWRLDDAKLFEAMKHADRMSGSTPAYKATRAVIAQLQPDSPSLKETYAYGELFDKLFAAYEAKGSPEADCAHLRGLAESILIGSPPGQPRPPSGPAQPG